MEKRGHINPLMDPFKFEANKNIIPDYKKDMCPKTLDLLSRAVNIPINPDSTEEDLDKLVEKIFNI
jgi:dTDP-4-amino-4,6-dideoxygalactose transaminase